MIEADISFAKASLQNANELRAKLLKFHPGEKGRFNENQLSKIIRRFLPRKMEIGTGFIACSTGLPVSPQQDIVVHDAINNVAVFHDEVFEIFPIEAVYGTIEVKTTLTRERLKESLIANSGIRKMAKNGKFYRLNVSRELEKDKFIADYLILRDELAPRFFLFGYSCNTDNIEILKQNFITLSQETNSHCHGLCVLDKDWFIGQNAYGKNAKGEPEFAAIYSANGFAIFLSALSLAMNSMQILQADLDRYEQAKIGFAEGSSAKAS